jgi:hypothetical protein
MKKAVGRLWYQAGCQARSYAGTTTPTASTSVEEGQKRVVEASLTLIRERARLKGEHVRSKGGAIATSCLLGVPLGHNSSFLQGPAFSPPRIREAIWCGSTNSTTETGVIKCLLPYRFLVLVLWACHLCLKTGRLIFSPKVCSLISQKQYSR